MTPYPDALRGGVPGGEKARLHTEAYEQRIQKRGGEVLQQIATAHTVLDRAKTREITFTIGEASRTFAKVGSGKNDTFSKGICDKMFGKTYTALDWEERNFVDNLVYILAKEYGLLMHTMREGDRFEFDFQATEEGLGKFKFYSKVKNAWLYSEVKPLMISERAKVVEHTREQLGASRLTAEALYQTGIRRTVLDIATLSGSLVATLEAFVKNISLEDRKKMLQGLDTFEETVDPSIRADNDTINGMNKYLRYHFKLEQGLTGVALEQKVKEHAVHPDGTGYRGTASQNLAWVYFIRYDILHYPPPAGSKLEPILAPERLPVRYELKPEDSLLPEAVPETAILEANAQLKGSEASLREQLGSDAVFLNAFTAAINPDALNNVAGNWTRIEVEGKFSLLGQEGSQTLSVVLENKPGSVDKIPLLVEEVVKAFIPLIRQKIAPLKEKKEMKEKEKEKETETAKALSEFQKELNFHEKERVYFRGHYEFLQEDIRMQKAKVQRMEDYANAVLGLERQANYEQAGEFQKQAEALKKNMGKQLRAYYEGDLVFLDAKVPHVDTTDYQVGLLQRLEELQTVYKRFREQEGGPPMQAEFERLIQEYENMRGLEVFWHQVAPTFSSKEQYVDHLLNRHLQTLQAQLQCRNKDYVLSLVPFDKAALLPTFELNLSLPTVLPSQEVRIRVTLPPSYRLQKIQPFIESFDFTKISNTAIMMFAPSSRSGKRYANLHDAVLAGAKELEALPTL